MKIKNRGFIYKVKRLKTRKHYCTTCEAYRTLELCNELRAQWFSKKGKTCEQSCVVFQLYGKGKPVDIELSMNEMYLSKDRYIHTMLVNFLSLVYSIIERCRQHGYINEQDYSTYIKYMKSLHRELHLKWEYDDGSN